jgi:hypothetical protein
MTVDDAIDQLPMLMYDYIRSNMSSPPKLEPVDNFQKLVRRLELRNRLCEKSVFKKDWRKVEDDDVEDSKKAKQIVNEFYKVRLPTILCLMLTDL